MCTKAAFEASGRSEGSVICDKPVVKSFPPIPRFRF